MTTNGCSRIVILCLLASLASGGSPVDAAAQTKAKARKTTKKPAATQTATKATTKSGTKSTTQTAAPTSATTDSTGTSKTPAATSATSDTPTTSSASKDDYTIPGGQEGTVFRSLTVEGEDRVHFEFERPALAPNLDPHKAPGLDPGNAADVLLRSGPDLVRPFTELSSHAGSPWIARPWLSHFSHGPVARFRPEVTDVERWKLMVANAKGETVATMEGKGKPPRDIEWDGRSKDGTTVVPDLMYSYVFEAYDRAGNKRNFVGEGFRVSAYRLQSESGPTLVFSARELAWPEVDANRASARLATPPILLESATWLNQSPRADRPVRVTVTARGYEQAETVAASVVRLLTPQLAGDPTRVKSQAIVQPDAPEGGTVTIGY
ncbi:MAG: hypothetical protein ACREOU_03850 [Candidatus Eiseniibacteriota bacterium]